MEDKNVLKSGPTKGDAPSPFALNQRFIVEAYAEDRGLRADVRNGFAMVSQKVTVKGLKLLVDVDSVSNSPVTRSARKGDLVYIREEYLVTAAWAKKRFSSDAIEGDFMIVDAQFVEFVVPQ